MSKCRICNSEEVSKVFEGQIRSGNFGKLTGEPYHVIKCSHCGCGYLDPFPVIDDQFYEDGSYREQYNSSVQVSNYQNEHDMLVNDLFGRIKLAEFRGKAVADFGSGGGSFLDAVTGYAKETIAVEPTQFFHDELKKRHRVFDYGNQLSLSGNTVDIATTFDVIEHTPDPVKFAEEIKGCLCDGGKLILTTPNYDDILIDTAGSTFLDFYYRTAHLYYFTGASIELILKAAGFSEIKVSYLHRYDLSNLLLWAKESRPTGIGKMDFFDEKTNYMYKKSVEESGRASDIWVEARK